MPLIGYKELSITEILELELKRNYNGVSLPQAPDLDVSGITQDTDLQDLPPQLELNINDGFESPTLEQRGSGFVTYLSPQKLRRLLEELVTEYGEEILDRDQLRIVNPEVFFNLWWYSARFSLPLPLATSSLLKVDPTGENLNLVDGKQITSTTNTHDCCAFASWDKSVALHGCFSAAKAIMAAQALQSTSDHLLREKLFDNSNTDISLLSFFNLQSYAQGDWDHPDFSESE